MRYTNIKKGFCLTLTLLVLVLLGTGCTKDGGTWFTSGDFDFFETAPPELVVESVTPENKTTNVSPEAILEVRFSQPIKADSVNPEGITLSYINPDLAETELTIHYEWFLLEGEKVLQIKPMGNLLPGEEVEFVLACDLKGSDDQLLHPASESFLNNVCYTAQFQVAE